MLQNTFFYIQKKIDQVFILFYFIYLFLAGILIYNKSIGTELWMEFDDT